MIIQNYESLISNSRLTTETNARRIMLELLDFGIKSVLAQNIISKSIKLTNETLYIQNFKINLSQIENIYIVGAGKASGGMAEVIEQILGSRITDGLINIPDGTKKRYKTHIIQLNEATHPIPSESGVLGAQKIIELIKKAKVNDLVIALFSGGGSALLTYPVNAIPLDDFNNLNRSLIKSGATIQEINTVRKHCSQIAGGRLAQYGNPAKIVTLILSDVINGSVDTIASGPTVPDPTTFNQAMEILKKYQLWEASPGSIQQYFQNGIKGNVPETPKPANKIFRKGNTIILGDIKVACESIKKYARERGFKSQIYSSEITGDAHLEGKKFLQYVKDRCIKGETGKSKPIILIAGGETTVKVTGSGKGGRCQEMGLTLLSEFKQLTGIVFAAMGTDGIDGFTDAAGVIIDNYSAKLAEEKRLNIEKFLNNNDSYHFFKELGDSLIFTGPTGTNVNDLMLFGIF
jgi:glycerate 2-kinase